MGGTLCLVSKFHTNAQCLNICVYKRQQQHHGASWWGSSAHPALCSSLGHRPGSTVTLWGHGFHLSLTLEEPVCTGAVIRRLLLTSVIWLHPQTCSGVTESACWLHRLHPIWTHPQVAIPPNWNGNYGPSIPCIRPNNLCRPPDSCLKLRNNWYLPCKVVCAYNKTKSNRVKDTVMLSNGWFLTL